MASQDITHWRNYAHPLRHLLVDSPQQGLRQRHTNLLHNLDEWSTVLESGSGSSGHHENPYVSIQALVQDQEHVAEDLSKAAPTGFSISVLILNSHDRKAVLLNIRSATIFSRASSIIVDSVKPQPFNRLGLCRVTVVNICFCQKRLEADCILTRYQCKVPGGAAGNRNHGLQDGGSFESHKPVGKPWIVR